MLDLSLVSKVSVVSFPLFLRSERLSLLSPITSLSITLSVESLIKWIVSLLFSIMPSLLLSWIGIVYPSSLACMFIYENFI